MISDSTFVFRLSCAVLTLLLIAPAIGLAADQAADEPLVVFLVRHAEKVDSSEDPELASAGKKRALELAAMLRDAGIEYVHSSDFIRTRATAAPIAGVLGLELELYDPHHLPAIAATVKATGGRHLIVGHSNTTGEVVTLLGGDPGKAIHDEEYDRLYVVTAEPEGVTTVLLRYGD